jgi:hypothetical protein
MGSATRHANEAYPAFGGVQTATQSRHATVASDSANAHTEHQLDQRMASGDNYSPMDANRSHHDASPGVGGSSETT